jgi:NADH-quinone oxidoreductase subunit K
MSELFLLVLSACIFFIGALGLLVRHNLLIMLMCIELMLNAVNLTFVVFSGRVGNLHGQLAVFFIITVAAAESAVGLALVIALFRNLKSSDSRLIVSLKG